MVDQVAEYIRSGGFVMLPLIFGMLLLWYALGYRFATLQRGNRRSVRILVERYRNGYPRRPAGIVDAAVVRGLSVTQSRTLELRRFLDEAFAEFETEIAKYDAVVRAIVRAAPLVGLLGTVTGMIETFSALGDMSLFSQSGGIAGGISQALISTQMGLAVAVPGLVVGRSLDRKQRMISFELAQIKDILCGEPEEAV